jgi:hypothetical protein
MELPPFLYSKKGGDLMKNKKPYYSFRIKLEKLKQKSEAGAELSAGAIAPSRSRMRSEGFGA